MEPDDIKQPELPPSEGDGQDTGAPLEGHPIEELPEAMHPTHALVIEAHAALKAGLAAYDRRGVGAGPNVDDVRLAFRALDAVLAEVNHG